MTLLERNRYSRYNERYNNYETAERKTPTIKAWVKTQRKLKLLAALTHESMMKALDRPIEQELPRVRQEGKKDE